MLHDELGDYFDRIKSCSYKQFRQMGKVVCERNCISRAATKYVMSCIEKSIKEDIDEKNDCS